MSTANENGKSAVSRLSETYRSTFVSLRHRNFRFYCMGVIVSLTGSLMQEIVVAWLGYQMTGSSLVLGSILFSYQLPMLVLGLLGGWAADRFDRKRIIVITQVLALGISLTWLTLSATGNLEVWHLYALSALFGSIVAFEIPARFAMIPQLVAGEDTLNAFSLDSLLFYSGRVAGPALGALFLTTLGATGCFALNSASYVLELVTLAFISPAARSAGASVGLKEAFAFTYGNREIRRILLMVAVFSFCGVYIPLMPAINAVLEGSARTNGLLIAASEMGAIIGSIYLANRLSIKAFGTKLRRIVGFAGISYATFLVLFALAPTVPLAVALVVPVGLSMTILLIGCHALVQEKADDRMRGVVSTVFWMYSYFGMFAIGGPALGWVADAHSIATAMTAAGIACATVAVIYLATLKAQATQADANS